MPSKPQYFCLIISLLVFQISLSAQCPEQGIPILKDEAAVDSFLTIYPNCDKFEVASYYAIDGKQIFWIKEDVQGFILTLLGILIVLHAMLYVLFKRVPWFQR